MRKRVRRGDDQAEVNMTPMLDIVFILLIFFIVTATFLQEQGIDMRPPPPSDEDTPDQDNPVILVQVDEDNRVFVNREPTSVDRVPAAVSRFLAEAPRSAVLIEVDNTADHGVVVQIYDDMLSNEVPAIIQRRSDES